LASGIDYPACYIPPRDCPMKLHRLIQSFVAAGAVAFFVAGEQRASADPTLNLSFAGTTHVATLTVTLDGNKMTGVEPGPYFFNEIPPPSGGGSPISTFCVQLTAGTTTSQAPYTVSALNTTSTASSIAANNPTNVNGVANAIEALYGMYYNTAWGSLSTFQSATSSVQAQASAFQLALWELTYDGTSDVANPNSNHFFSSGNFQTGSGSAEQEAQTMLNNVLNNISQGITDFNQNLPGETLVILTNPTYQDQIFLESTPKVPPSVATPAPPGVFLAGFGLIALMGRARLLRRKPAVA
jgi:hypothetical protein